MNFRIENNSNLRNEILNTLHLREVQPDYITFYSFRKDDPRKVINIVNADELVRDLTRLIIVIQKGGDIYAHAALQLKRDLQAIRDSQTKIDRIKENDNNKPAAEEVEIADEGPDEDFDDSIDIEGKNVKVTYLTEQEYNALTQTILIAYQQFNEIKESSKSRSASSLQEKSIRARNKGPQPAAKAIDNKADEVYPKLATIPRKITTLGQIVNKGVERASEQAKARDKLAQKRKEVSAAEKEAELKYDSKKQAARKASEKQK